MGEHGDARDARVHTVLHACRCTMKIREDVVDSLERRDQIKPRNVITCRHHACIQSVSTQLLVIFVTAVCLTWRGDRYSSIYDLRPKRHTPCVL
jgi:hypothetical protein